MYAVFEGILVLGAEISFDENGSVLRAYVTCGHVASRVQISRSLTGYFHMPSSTNAALLLLVDSKVQVWNLLGRTGRQREVPHNSHEHYTHRIAELDLPDACYDASKAAPMHTALIWWHSPTESKKPGLGEVGVGMDSREDRKRMDVAG